MHTTWRKAKGGYFTLEDVKMIEQRLDFSPACHALLVGANWHTEPYEAAQLVQGGLSFACGGSPHSSCMLKLEQGSEMLAVTQVQGDVSILEELLPTMGLVPAD